MQGAPEYVLSSCSSALAPSGPQPLTGVARLLLQRRICIAKFPKSGLCDTYKLQFGMAWHSHVFPSGTLLRVNAARHSFPIRTSAHASRSESAYSAALSLLITHLCIRSTPAHAHTHHLMISALLCLAKWDVACLKKVSSVGYWLKSQNLRGHLCSASSCKVQN